MKTFYAHGFRPASGFHGKRLGAPFPMPDFDITLPPIGPLPPMPPGDLAPAPAPAAEPAPAPSPAPAPMPVPAPLPVEFNTQPLFPYTYPVYPITTPALPPAPESSEYKIPTYVWAGGAALAAALVVALVLSGKKS